MSVNNALRKDQMNSGSLGFITDLERRNQWEAAAQEESEVKVLWGGTRTVRTVKHNAKLLNDLPKLEAAKLELISFICIASIVAIIALTISIAILTSSNPHDNSCQNLFSDQSNKIAGYTFLGIGVGGPLLISICGIARYRFSDGYKIRRKIVEDTDDSYFKSLLSPHSQFSPQITSTLQIEDGDA